MLRRRLLPSNVAKFVGKGRPVGIVVLVGVRFVMLGVGVLVMGRSGQKSIAFLSLRSFFVKISY